MAFRREVVDFAREVVDFRRAVVGFRRKVVDFFAEVVGFRRGVVDLFREVAGFRRAATDFRRDAAAVFCLAVEVARRDVLGFFLRDWPDSDIAIATACLRLLTFLPEPLANSPRLYSRITRPTFFLFFCFVSAMTAPAGCFD